MNKTKLATILLSSFLYCLIVKFVTLGTTITCLILANHIIFIKDMIKEPERLEKLKNKFKNLGKIEKMVVMLIALVIATILCGTPLGLEGIIFEEERSDE